MSKVEELEQGVLSLTPEQRAEFDVWYEAYKATAWDRQIEADAGAGRLDFLIEEAEADLDAGRFNATQMVRELAKEIQGGESGGVGGGVR